MGSSAFYIQELRSNCGTLFCTLNSIRPHERWPFVGMEALPPDYDEPATVTDAEPPPHGFGRLQLIFDDTGALLLLSRWQSGVQRLRVPLRGREAQFRLL